MNPPLKPSLRHHLKAISPSYWLMNYYFSEEWDLNLRKLMANHKFEHLCQFTAVIGGKVVWKANHPYASFQPYNGPSCRPSRATIAMAHEKMLKDLYGT